jgi:hypothetical protein
MRRHAAFWNMERLSRSLCRNGSAIGGKAARFAEK